MVSVGGANQPGMRDVHSLQQQQRRRRSPSVCPASHPTFSWGAAAAGAGGWIAGLPLLAAASGVADGAVLASGARARATVAVLLARAVSVTAAVVCAGPGERAECVVSVGGGNQPGMRDVHSLQQQQRRRRSPSVCPASHPTFSWGAAAAGAGGWIAGLPLLAAASGVADGAVLASGARARATVAVLLARAVSVTAAVVCAGPEEKAECVVSVGGGNQPGMRDVHSLQQQQRRRRSPSVCPASHPTFSWGAAAAGAGGWIAGLPLLAAASGVADGAVLASGARARATVAVLLARAVSVTAAVVCAGPGERAECVVSVGGGNQPGMRDVHSLQQQQRRRRSPSVCPASHPTFSWGAAAAGAGGWIAGLPLLAAASGVADGTVLASGARARATVAVLLAQAVSVTAAVVCAGPGERAECVVSVGGGNQPGMRDVHSLQQQQRRRRSPSVCPASHPTFSWGAAAAGAGGWIAGLPLLAAASGVADGAVLASGARARATVAVLLARAVSVTAAVVCAGPGERAECVVSVGVGNQPGMRDVHSLQQQQRRRRSPSVCPASHPTFSWGAAAAGAGGWIAGLPLLAAASGVADGAVLASGARARATVAVLLARAVSVTAAVVCAGPGERAECVVSVGGGNQPGMRDVHSLQQQQRRRRSPSVCPASHPTFSWGAAAAGAGGWIAGLPLLAAASGVADGAVLASGARARATVAVLLARAVSVTAAVVCAGPEEKAECVVSVGGGNQPGMRDVHSLQQQQRRRRSPSVCPASHPTFSWGAAAAGAGGWIAGLPLLAAASGVADGAVLASGARARATVAVLLARAVSVTAAVVCAGPEEKAECVVSVGGGNQPGMRDVHSLQQQQRRRRSPSVCPASHPTFSWGAAAAGAGRWIAGLPLLAAASGVADGAVLASGARARATVAVLLARAVSVTAAVVCAGPEEKAECVVSVGGGNQPGMRDVHSLQQQQRRRRSPSVCPASHPTFSWGAAAAGAGGWIAGLPLLAAASGVADGAVLASGARARATVAVLLARAVSVTAAVVCAGPGERAECVVSVGVGNQPGMRDVHSLQQQQRRRRSPFVCPASHPTFSWGAAAAGAVGAAGLPGRAVGAGTAHGAVEALYA